MTAVVAMASVGTDLFRAVLQGAAPGSVYALVALGFVITYKTSGVFNLAFGAQAYVSAAMYFKAKVEWGWGTVPAVVVSVVVLAPLVGLILERLIFRHLRTASAAPKLVAAIGLAVALPSVFELLANFQAVAGRTPVGVVPNGASVFYDPFGSYPFSRDELVAMGVAVVAVVGLVALFRLTSLGLQMRAVVESPRMTELNGIDADRVSTVAWVLSSFFAGVAGVLIAPRFNTLAAPDFFNLMVVAIAAAAIGRLTSLPRALAGGLGLGIVIAELNTFLPRWSADVTWLRPLQDNLTPAIPFVVLFGVLVLQPGIRRAHDAGDPLAGVDPPPSVSAPPPTAGRHGLTTARVAMVVAGLVICGVAFVRADDVWLFLITQAVVYGTIYLSITVVTGMAGQISLCQGAFAAIGAFTVFQLVDRYDVPVLAAALVGAAVAAGAGAVLSLPIRRLGGVWTAIATLAFAYFFDAVLVRLPWVGGGTSLLTGTVVPRPVIGPWDLGNDRSFLVLAVVVLVVAAFAVTRLASGTFGHTLQALRGSEIGARSVGISPGRARGQAFAIAGFLAGLGGALLAMHQENVNYGTNFSPFAALFWLVLVVTVGISSVEGAVVAAMTFSLLDAVLLQGAVVGWVLRSADRIPDLFPLPAKWRFILAGLGAIQFARHPEGILQHRRHRQAARRPDEVPAV
jgi:branched-subunit amino acid ABC-type transport system permease component